MQKKVYDPIALDLKHCHTCKVHMHSTRNTHTVHTNEIIYRRHRTHRKLPGTNKGAVHKMWHVL